MSDETEFLSLITDVESNLVAIREFLPYPEPRCSDERFANYDERSDVRTINSAFKTAMKSEPSRRSYKG